MSRIEYWMKQAAQYKTELAEERRLNADLMEYISTINASANQGDTKISYFDAQTQRWEEIKI